ncbi:hypothetical protein BF17_00505 [Yersinia similis]|uniref:Acetyltransferase domain-containing protein n=1 Tax=Yersinia similis TaxID=367190 RepID=A0ABN4CGJ4_9GAMM|nr:hypothetical protein [Yersinia similis]AHK18011.1 hypothetical protein BF17_00505 [Yersinia similis]CFQ62769.1 acetyltransferase domain-containing protein [Yersinia similis]
MYINYQTRYLFSCLTFFSFSSFANINMDNACFYLNDNYLEKEESDKVCLSYYTEDDWLDSKWNKNISSIRVPLSMRVDIFSGYSFTGEYISLYQDTNLADLEQYGFKNNISSYRVLPKNLYPENKRVVLSYNSEVFSERYIGYNYYSTQGHNILLKKYHQHIDADGQSASIFYSHAGQIMTAFIGQGFDRNIYCLSPTNRRSNSLSLDVAFTYCDFNNSGQNWFPRKIADKVVLINRGSGAALSLDDVGFYVALHQNNEGTLAINENTLWFDDEKIEELKAHAVRPFLQYKESLEAMNEESQRKVIVHHLDKPDDMYIYLDDRDNGRYYYYNVETKIIIAYNKIYSGNEKISSACLSLLNDSTSQHSPVSFTYHQSNYSNNTFEYGCDNGVAYDFYTKKWHFMPDWEYYYLVNGDENKVLHFYVNDKPQYSNFRGTLTGPKPSTHIGVAVGFSERRPQDAVFISNPALGYVFDVEKAVCQLSGSVDDEGLHCPEFKASWLSTDDKIQSANLSHYYIPWLLTKISKKLSVSTTGDVLNLFAQKIHALKISVDRDNRQQMSRSILEQTKALLVEFLHSYNSVDYEDIWHQAAYVLNRVEILIDKNMNAQLQ